MVEESSVFTEQVITDHLRMKLHYLKGTGAVYDGRMVLMGTDSIKHRTSM